MGYIFLALYAVTLFMLYIAIRRAWAQTMFLGAVGAGLNSLWVILFSLVEADTSLAQALFAALVMGLLFTGGVVIVAVFFRTNQPSPDVQIVSQRQPPPLSNLPDAAKRSEGAPPQDGDE